LPYVKIELLEGRSEEQKARIAQAVTEALVEHGGASAASVFVVFDNVAPGDWAVGGTLLSRRGARPAGG